MIELAYAVPTKLIKVNAGADIFKGQLVKVDSLTAKPATEGISTAIYYGLAVDDIESGNTGYIQPLDGILLSVEVYTGGTKKYFDGTDVGKLYELKVSSGNMMVNPDSTTSPCFHIEGYDPITNRAFARMKKSLLYF